MDHSQNGLPGVDSAKFTNGACASLKMVPAGEDAQIIVIDPAGSEFHQYYTEIKIAGSNCDTGFRVACLLHKWISEHGIEILSDLDESWCSEILEVEVLYVDSPPMFGLPESATTTDVVEVEIRYKGDPVVFTLESEVGDGLSITLSREDVQTADNLTNVRRRLRRWIYGHTLAELLECGTVIWSERIKCPVSSVHRI